MILNAENTIFCLLKTGHPYFSPLQAESGLIKDSTWGPLFLTGDRYFSPLQAESGLILNRTNHVVVISTALFSVGPPQQG